MPYLNAKSGVRWQYDIAGEGEPIIFIHGWGVNGRIWRQQFKRFSQTHQAIIIDLPGHGQSTWKHLSLDEMAEDMLQLLGELNLKDTNIVGSSIGGLLALKIYELSKDSIKRIVFVGSQPKFSQSIDYPFGLEIERIRKLAHQLREDYRPMIDVFFRSLFTKEERATRRFKWIKTFRKAESLPDIEAVLSLLDILEKEDLRDLLLSIDCPVQFIYGTEDYICPETIYHDLKEKLPHARFDAFEKTGHFPFLINPHAFNCALEEFLSHDSSLN